jgi:Uma2 family endonuclease
MIAAPAPSLPHRGQEIPEPLENGERMSAPEFFRRYMAMPHVKKAELIEGIVYMGSPVRVDVHADPDNLIQTWLGLYAARTPGVKASANGTIQLDLDNVPQPDAMLRIVDGGTSKLEEGYLVGPPELVVEIAASSKKIDSHEKLRAYRRNGVKEYIIWRTLEGELDWFRLEGGTYVRQETDAAGICRSAVFPGLALNVKALLAQDGAGVIENLMANLGTTEHREFVARLAKEC